jgi:hypothetical protein
LRGRSQAFHNASMTRKTKLYVAAYAEVCLASYFMLGFMAWTIRLVLFPTGPGPVSLMMSLWATLSLGCFTLFWRTRRKLKQLESDPEARVKKAPVKTEKRIAEVEGLKPTQS